MKRLLKWLIRIVFILLLFAFIWVFVAYWRSTNDCGKTAAPTNPMKAIVYCDYGVANLKLEDVEKPVPNDDQILVKVHAVSVNPYDWHFIEGTPKFMRAMIGGLRKPKDTRLGVDFAGTVETVGKNVTQYKPGDEVFGGSTGAFAQYLCRRATGSVAPKPAGLTFEQAASINIAGITALQGVRDKGKVQPGQKGLIDGGGANEQGLIGPLALPIKAMVYSWFVPQKMGMMMAQPSTHDLTLLAEMVESGKLKPVIDRTYKSLSEVPDAIRYLEQGHARGKVVITVE